MPRFFLASYTIRLRDRPSDTYQLLGNFTGPNDLLAVFNQYLANRQATYSHDTASQKLLRVLQFASQSRSISGVVETGEYGYESTLYDVQTAAVSYQRTTNDAEMLPFYFLAHVPAQRDEGVLLLERMGQLGIRKVFLGDFIDYFHQYHPSIDVEFNPLVPQQLVTQYLQGGRVTKLRFIRFSVPSDITDAYDRGGHEEEAGYIEFVVHARRNRRIPIISRIRDVVDGRRQVSNMIEIRGFEYDSVKVEIEMEGNRRTIDLSNLMKLRAQYDVTPDIQIGANGHPVFSSIDAVAKRLLEDLLSSMNAGGSNV